MTTSGRHRRRATDISGAEWALILGASSGFGKATALELASHGFNIAGVHFDRKAALKDVEDEVEQIRSYGVEVKFFNINAADAEKRKEVLDVLSHELRDGKGMVKVLMHSLAFGTLKPYIPKEGETQLTQDQMEMTVDVMAHSLVYWTQDLFHRRLIGQGSRIFAMTSEGNLRAWAYYGAVSAAKCALESHIRQLAVELAPHGVTANAIQAGVTDTPALRKIPGHEQMIISAKKRNPAGRLTTPEDVARAIALLASQKSQWITANVIRVDGAEFIS